MKKVFTGIIVAICFFSIASSTNALEKEGYIEQILDLNYGPEEYDIHLQHLTPLYFQESSTNQMFANFDQANELLKNEIIRQYRSGELSRDKVSSIVSAHKKFVYYTDRLFYYVAIKEQGHGYAEIDNAILKSYKSARSYYRQVKYISLKK